MSQSNTSEKPESDPKRIYIYNYWIYVFTGFWKYDFAKKWKTNLFKTYQFILTIFYVIIIMSFGVDAYLVRNNLEKLSFNMTSSVLVFVTVIKIILLRKERDNLENVMLHLKHKLFLSTVGESPEDKAILDKKAKDILLTTKLFYLILGILYPLRLLADTAFGTRAYIIPIPFKELFDPYYEIAYMCQATAIAHFLITVIAHDMLIYGVIIRFIAHYEILKKNINKIKNLYPRRNFEKYVAGYEDGEDRKSNIHDVLIGKNNSKESVKNILNECGFDKLNMINWGEKENDREEKVFRMLTDCILHHQILIQQVQSFCQIYSTPLLIQAIGAVALIGIVILYIIFISTDLTVLLAQQVLYVGTTMLNILYLCSFGTDITFKSKETGNALYDTPWYDMDIKNQKIILFILKNLDKSPEFKGGGMVTINRVTYLKFLQTSYNMVAVLKNAY